MTSDTMVTVTAFVVADFKLAIVCFEVFLLPASLPAFPFARAG